jgi:hypothetical protein
VNRKLLATVMTGILLGAGINAADGTHNQTGRETVTAGTIAAVPLEAARRYGWGTPIWSDEFQYTGKPLSSKWSVYNGPGHAGKGRRTPTAVSVSRGALHMVGDSKGNTGGMSARATSSLYQRVETRMKMNPGQDPAYHPVLILWPSNRNDAYSGRCWEIDYAEGNKGPGLISFFNHIACSGKVHTWARKAIDLTQWHNYAVEWGPGRVIGYIDGVKWFEDRNPRNVSNVKMHQTIQLDWFPGAGAPKTTTMHVDWTRTYKVTR